MAVNEPCHALPCLAWPRLAGLAGFELYHSVGTVAEVPDLEEVPEAS